MKPQKNIFVQGYKEGKAWKRTLVFQLLCVGQAATISLRRHGGCLPWKMHAKGRSCKESRLRPGFVFDAGCHAASTCLSLLPS